MTGPTPDPAAATPAGPTGPEAEPATTAPAGPTGPGAEPATTAPVEPAGGPAPDPDTDPTSDPETSRTTDITAGPGGVMTEEVGVITGQLTVRSVYADGQVTLYVQYKDADEWYLITGGRAKLADPAGLDAVHTIAVGLLDRPYG
jgi:hypothetical protein